MKNRKYRKARRINLSRCNNLSLHFINDSGSELLNMDFSRDSEESPVIKVHVIGRSGDVQTGVVLFDVAA